MNTTLDHHAQVPPAEASTFDFDRPELQLPAWVKGKWPKVVQGTLYAIAFITAYVAGFGATGNLLTSYAIVLLVYFASIIAHEAGHWLGALVAGRRVIAAQLSWIGLWRLRRGWRVRLARPRDAAGWVLAVTMENRSSRLATAVFLGGGIIANAVLATAGALGVARHGLGEGWPWFALAVLNLAMLLTSLIPHAARYHTDGLHLIAVARGKRSSRLGELMEHIVARTIAGRVEIPLAELQALQESPGGGTMFAHHLMIGAHLRAGAEDKAQTEALNAISAYEALGPQEKVALAPFNDLIRLDLALIDADAATLRSIRVDKEIDFRAPYLELRRQAFLAAMEGDVSGAEKTLARHESSSENSIDAGSRASERMWRERIRTLLHQQAATQVAVPNRP